MGENERLESRRLDGLISLSSHSEGPDKPRLPTSALLSPQPPPHPSLSFPFPHWHDTMYTAAVVVVVQVDEMSTQLRALALVIALEIKGRYCTFRCGNCYWFLLN